MNYLNRLLKLLRLKKIAKIIGLSIIIGLVMTILTVGHKTAGNNLSLGDYSSTSQTSGYPLAYVYQSETRQKQNIVTSETSIEGWVFLFDTLFWTSISLIIVVVAYQLRAKNADLRD
jgi:hypothetical protein